MALQFSLTLRNGRLDNIGTVLGSGGSLPCYTGSPPGVGNAPTGTHLCTFTSVTYAGASGGTKTYTATSDSAAAASGTPGYGRLLTSGGTAHAEFDVTVGGAGTMNFNSAISAGATVTLSSAAFTEGNP